jgi:hypothetical protein
MGGLGLCVHLYGSHVEHLHREVHDGDQSGEQTERD